MAAYVSQLSVCPTYGCLSYATQPKETPRIDALRSVSIAKEHLYAMPCEQAGIECLCQSGVGFDGLRVR